MSQEVLNKVIFWVFTSISAFLAYQVWEMNSTLERLSVEVRHLAEVKNEISTLQLRVTSLERNHPKHPIDLPK